MPILSQLFSYGLQHATRSNGLKTLLAFVLAIVFKYRKHAIGTRPRPDLKQPRFIVPFLGHMPLMTSIHGTKLYDFYEKHNNELGPVWSISLPIIGRMIQADLPEHVEYVLKTNFWNYEKSDGLRDAMGDLFGHGIFAQDGPKWRYQRKLASHIFTVRAFKEYVSEVFLSEGQKVVDYLGEAADNGTVVDFHQLMLHFTLDSFGSVSFGESFGCLDRDNIEHEVPFAKSFDDLTSTCSDRLVDPAWRIRERLTNVGKKAQYDKKLISEHSYRLIKKRREQGYDPEKKKDLLQWFIEATDDEGNTLSDEVIKDFILNFTIAGRDTTAQALSWMFYLLLRTGNDPKVHETLVREVDEVLQGQSPSYESHKKQKYAEACMYEALRLYPSVPRNLKKCVKDDVLPDGTKIYAGEWFCWSSYVMGRSELVWGQDAKEYKPSRWIDTEKPSQGKFNSFHAGPRVCLGQQFATIEGLTMISLILSQFTMELVNPDKLPPYGVSVTMPMLEGLPMRIHRKKDTLAAQEH